MEVCRRQILRSLRTSFLEHQEFLQWSSLRTFHFRYHRGLLWDTDTCTFQNIFTHIYVHNKDDGFKRGWFAKDTAGFLCEIPESHSIYWWSDRLCKGSSKNCVNGPSWCSSVDWAQACERKGCWFNSQSGHMPGLQARSPVGGMQEATTHWCFPLFLLLFFSL